MSHTRTFRFTAAELATLYTDRKATIRRPITVPAWWEGHRIFAKCYPAAAPDGASRGSSIGCEVVISARDGGKQKRCPYGSPGDMLVAAKFTEEQGTPRMVFVRDVVIEYIGRNGQVYTSFEEFDKWLDEEPDAEVRGRWVIDVETPDIYLP